MNAHMTSPAIAWLLGLVGLALWMLFHPRSNSVPKIVLLFLALAIIGPITEFVMRFEAAHFPWKYDYFLYRIDETLGLSAFSLARRLSPGPHAFLFSVYESLTVASIVCYGVNLKRNGGAPNRLLIAYAVLILVGPCMYMVVPGCGPRHAFGADFPLGHPQVEPILVKFNGWPNAMPSLHMASALLFVFFAGTHPALLGLAVLYLIGTIGGTLALEHYVIDLIVAVPLACFVTHAVFGRVKPALFNLVGVLAWILAIRFGISLLLASSWLLRALALVTVVWPSYHLLRTTRATSYPSTAVSGAAKVGK